MSIIDVVGSAIMLAWVMLVKKAAPRPAVVGKDGHAVGNLKVTISDA